MPVGLRGRDPSIDAGLGREVVDRFDFIRDVGMGLGLAMLEANGLTTDDAISVLFTATPDLHAAFPATAARHAGFGDVPLICAQEIDVQGALASCIRIMLHVTTELPRAAVCHVYLHGAKSLRDDVVS